MTERMPVPAQWDTDVSHVTAQGYRIASRVIFPQGGDLDVLPLYVDKNHDDVVQLRPENILGRDSFRIVAGERVSFGSYFNAFAASYWRRWTVVNEVRLVINTSGAGQIAVYRTNARGVPLRIDTRDIAGDAIQSVFDLPLQTFGDGGFYWFEIIAATEVVLDSAQWWVAESDRPHGTLTLSTTTYNKPDYVVRNLGLMSQDPNLLGVLDQVLIVDQGTEKVVDEPGYTEAAASLGELVDVIEQPNMGGSGGFARGQYESTVRGLSDYVVLLDDDISIETESFIRLATFADMCKSPTLVGGHMFDLLNRTSLHTFGEIVDPNTWQPTVPGADQYLSHNFNKYGLRESRWMHTRIDVDYNGWWMCLIPTRVIREVGLSLPLFIKWDDVEYGLRARDHGFPTVSLPGSAVWHIAWGDKDDLVGWQAYFHERNRLLTCMLHTSRPKGGQVLYYSQTQDLKHLVSMQYYTIQGRLLGQRDLLAGPSQLHDLLVTRNAEVRGMAKEYSDSQLKPEYETFPPIRTTKIAKPPRRRARNEDDPREALPINESRLRLILKGGFAVLRQFLPMDEHATENPQVHIPHKDNKWWNTAQWDSALVSNAEGTGLSWYRRQPKMTKALMGESVSNHVKLLQNWDRLAAEYREALPRITSLEAWEATFGITHDANDQASARAEVND